MSSKPLVSGITIFLNAETFIQEAIESVFAQTYSNWELLLVDDGSTDGSTAIACQYAQQYPMKVRYLEHENHKNRGMSASRNLGIYHAKGDYIAFLDADDVWLPHKLERQVAILESQPEADMVGGPTQCWFSWTEEPEDIRRDCIREIGLLPNRLYKPPALLVSLLRNKANSPATCSVLIRTRLLIEVSGFEETFRDIFEDQAFFTKVYLKACVFITSEYWDRYRQHPNSSCFVAQKAGTYSRSSVSSKYLIFLNWVAGYLSKERVEDPEVWQALQKGLWLCQHPVLYRLQQTRRQFKSRLMETLKF